MKDLELPTMMRTEKTKRKTRAEINGEVIKAIKNPLFGPDSFFW